MAGQTILFQELFGLSIKFSTQPELFSLSLV